MLELATAGRTEIGNVRKTNEDAWRVYRSPAQGSGAGRGHVLALADGMGTYRAGAQASSMAVDQLAIFHHTPEGSFRGVDTLGDLVFKSNDVITGMRTREPEFYGMGATVTVAWLSDDLHHAVVFHAGDSAAFLCRSGRLLPITTLHKDPDTGKLTSHLGAGPQFRLEKVKVPLRPGDLLLLTSDGVHGFLGHEQMRDCLRNGTDLDGALDLLFYEALKTSDDNLTAVVARIST
jgi:serine/threonine protein phosphatase PrpC